MSGGVGPTYDDITLPEEQEHELKQTQDPKTSSEIKKAGFFPFWKLNALAVMIVFLASGMVSPGDLAFLVFSFIYIFFLSKFSFPTLPSSQDPQSKFLRLCVLLSAIIGLVIPIAYIFEGILEGDKQGIKAAAPHVFLLASQGFMEGVVFSDRFSAPVRVFVPAFYNSKRVFTLVDWLREEFSKVHEGYGGSARILYLGKVLALANLVFWSINLFGFLLPFYVPIKALRKYYSAYNEVKDK